MIASAVPSLPLSEYRDLLKGFLAEDTGPRDATTLALIPAGRKAQGRIFAKSEFVVAGLAVALETFRILDDNVAADVRHRDGDVVTAGAEIAHCAGSARALLTGERVALNLLQRLSGIATLTRRFVEAVQGTRATILDTRKTTPGLRALEKYAVRVGGGSNHRMNLADAMLIKENHIRLAGGIDRALQLAQGARKQVRWLEIEVTNLQELREALEHGPDAVLLDNMTPDMVREAVALVRSKARNIIVEASGGMQLQNVRSFAEAGVDCISVGALTHSAPAVDISFEIEPA